MAKFEELPAHVFAEIKRDLANLLARAKTRFRAEHAFLQMIDVQQCHDDIIEFRSPPAIMWIQPKRAVTVPVHVLGPTMKGMTRWAVYENRVVMWPNDPGSENWYVGTGGGVTGEMVGPIHYKGKTTGIVLLDRLDGQFDDQDRNGFESFLHEVDQVVSVPESEQNCIEKLHSIMTECYKLTDSARGYIAVKRWDGRLEYITAGLGKFLTLSAHEGLCGRVLRTGQYANPTNLLAVDDYIASVDEIKSEIVYPIKDGGDVVGIINLESYVKGAYDESTVEFLAAQAARAVPSTRVFRRDVDPRFGRALADLLESSLMVVSAAQQHEGPLVASVEDDIYDALLLKARALLPGRESEMWIREEKSGHLRLMAGMAWNDAAKGGIVVSGGSSVVLSPVLVEGEPIAIVAVLGSPDAGTSQSDMLQALCRIAGEAIRQWRYEQRVRLYIELVHLLSNDAVGEVEMVQVIKAVPFVFESDHCTLFFKRPIPGRELFIPGPSTADDIIHAGAEYGYWADARDGLTGYVAKTGRPLNIRDVADQREIALVDENLAWRRKMSEDVGTNCRSFLGFPIFSSVERGQIIGVLRTHRDLRSRKSGFSLENVAMMRTLAFLLAPPLQSFLKRWPGRSRVRPK